jgi:hypothetical protein
MLYALFEQNMNKELTDTDMRRLLPGIPIMTYTDLFGYKSLSDLMRKGAAVILYPNTSIQEGHWTGVLYTVDDRGKKVIEFFDPYGISPDREFRIGHIKQPHIMSLLLARSRYETTYNEHMLQQPSERIATCGRHVVNRIRYAHMPLSEYLHLFGTRDGVTGDQIVVEMVK